MYTVLILTVFCITFVSCEFRCERPWQLFKKSCYLPSSDIDSKLLTWSNAKKSCENFGSNLVSIGSADENQFVLSLMIGVQPEIWIGLRNNDPILGHFWVDYSPYEPDKTYVNWLPNQPDNGDSIGLESCTEMYTNTSSFKTIMVKIGYWNDANCQALNNYVCKKPSHNAPAGMVFGCESGWVEFNGKCFKIFSNLSELEKAKDVCKQFSMTSNQLNSRSTMLTIRDLEDEEFILTQTWGIVALWLGIDSAHNLGTQTIIWDDDLMEFGSYINWLDGNPMENPPIRLLTTPLHFGKWTDNNYNSGYAPSSPTMAFACTQYKHYYTTTTSIQKFLTNFDQVECPANFVAYGINCYHFADVFMNFTESVNYCQQLSQPDKNLIVDLGSVLNPLDENFLTFQMKQANIVNQHWIGLEKLVKMVFTTFYDGPSIALDTIWNFIEFTIACRERTNETYKWIDDWSFQYTIQETDNANFCATVSVVNSKLTFSQSQCSTKLQPICKGQILRTILTKSESPCSYKSGCYSIGVNNMYGDADYFGDMQKACRNQDKELAEFTSYAEVANLINVKDMWQLNPSDEQCLNYGSRSDNKMDKRNTFMGYTYPSHPYFYIGLLKRKEEDFLHWASDNTKGIGFEERWGIGEPSHSTSSNEYDLFIVIDHFGYWHTVTSLETWQGGASKCYPGLCKTRNIETTTSTSTSTTLLTTMINSTSTSTTTSTSTNASTSTISTTSTTSVSSTISLDMSSSTSFPATTNSTDILNDERNNNSIISTAIGTVFGVVILISLLIVLYKFRFDILNKLRSGYRLHVPEELEVQ